MKRPLDDRVFDTQNFYEDGVESSSIKIVVP